MHQPKRMITTRSRTAARILGIMAAISLLGSTSVSAQELGRLFFTPQQRAELDRLRQSNATEMQTVVESAVTVNGQVTRSSGKTTTWINGVPQDDTHGSREPGRVRLDTGALKVGQTLDRVRGEVQDGLKGGEIRVNRGLGR